MIALPITATISPPAAMSSAVIGVLLRSWAFCLREGRSSSGHFDRILGIGTRCCPCRRSLPAGRGAACRPVGLSSALYATPADLQLFQASGRLARLARSAGPALAMWPAPR